MIMKCKVIQKIGLTALVLAILSGCGKTTHVTREDQLAHVTNPPTTSIAAEETVDTSAVAADTKAAVTETPDTAGTTAAPQTDPASIKTTKPASTKATRATEPPETTVPETTGESQQMTEPTEEGTDPYDISGYTCGNLEYGILDAVNAGRREAGMPELTLDHRLSAVASVRAYEASGSFSHTRPDGRDFSTVLADYGYGYGHAGENLLQCSDGYSAADMVALWMGSAGHRANILDPEAATLGVGVYRSGGMVYVAAIFTD